ncbi:cation transporter [Methanosarcina sp. KYL-1]|uniref:cation diffusion facilitator family transporter n=1 Tax=Methanosarcina sp. KYL-1 TaxID=2602068 RepID=UPI0021019158|nr:cation diffusion facilitator family transporter [Methanosarcina sp. KYL-1]MCQ1535656.1 cation transporter [Methanosarcina sp. KYL-1]
MNQEERFKQAVRVTGAGLLVNLGLTIFKLFAGVLGNSAAMVADAVHSLSDFLTDLVVIFGFKIARKPVDKSHNYGHGKVETLSASLVGLMLFVVAGEIFYYGMQKILLVANGGSLEQPGMIALYAALLSIVSKELMYQYTIRQARKINSIALKANAWHHRSDAFSSVCTMAGVGGAIFLGGRWVVLDPVMAVILSLFIFKVGLKVSSSSINELIEASLDEKTLEKIKQIIRNTEGVRNFTNLKTRRIGSEIAVDVEIKVDSALNIGEADRVSLHVEHSLKKVFGPYTYVLVKAEPDVPEPPAHPEKTGRCLRHENGPGPEERESEE